MEKRQINRKWIVGGVAYAILLFLIFTLGNLTTINQWLGTLWRVIRPVVIGLALAYIINPFFNFFEKKIFCRFQPPALRRFLSLLLSYLLIIAIIVCLFWMILPQLIESIVSLVKNYEAYVQSVADYINGFLRPLNRFLQNWTQKFETIHYLNADGMILSISNFFSSIEFGKEGGLLDTENITQITTVLSEAVSIVTDTVFGIFISLYLLASKEKRVAQVMRLRNAIFSDKVNGRISRVISTIDHSFGGFIKGKILDSMIIWVLSYLLFSVFNIPFELLCSAFVAICNIVPIIGPLIGAIPTSILVLLTEPAKFFPFLLIIILIQQIDGNIISPKILGDNTGISSLCVVIAIATMGALWGFVGMILGVPIFAAFLKLSDYYLEKKLQIKGLPSEIESYYPADALVDPVKDSHMTTDRAVKRLEKNVLRIKTDLQSKTREELSGKDRFRLRVYEFAQKHHILSDIEDETIVQFSASQQQARIIESVEQRFAQPKDSQQAQS